MDEIVGRAACALLNAPALPRRPPRKAREGEARLSKIGGLDRTGGDPLGSGLCTGRTRGMSSRYDQREWARVERSLSKSCGLRPPRSVRGDERDPTYGE